MKRASSTLEHITIGAKKGVAASRLLAYLADAKLLNGLQLSRLEISSSSFPSITSLSSGLTYIRFSDCCGLDDTTIDRLAALPNLKTLVLLNTNQAGVAAGAEGVQRIAANVPQLNSVQLNKVSWETKSGAHCFLHGGSMFPASFECMRNRKLPG